MKIPRVFSLTVLALAALALSACAGPLPEGLSFDLESAEAAELEFTAPVEAIGPEAWTIGGLTVVVTSATEISGAPEVGDVVKVHAFAFPDVGLMAREIERVGMVEPVQTTATPPPGLISGREVEFVAPVVSIAADSWTIGERTVAISPATEIKGVIVVGDLVKVHALVRPDLSLVAREIEPAEADDFDDDDLDDFDDEHIKFKGTVQSIEGQTWLVGGLTFRVTGASDIRDSVGVGDFVEVRAVWSEDGVLFAIRIELEDDDRSGPNRGSDDDHEDDDDDGDDDDDDRSGSNSGQG